MKQRHRPGEEHIRGNLTNPTPQLRPESTRAPMWPPILPRFSSGGGGGQGSNFNYGDMEQWLPGRISSSKNSKSRHSRKPIPNNPEYEIYEDDGERVKIEYFVYEKSCKDRLKRFFFKNKTTSLTVLIILFLLKLASCILYVVRVIQDTDRLNATCYECEDKYDDIKNEGSEILGIHWWALIWVNRPVWMWAAQVGIALFTLIVTLLMTILRYKGNVWELLTGNFYLELVTTIPFIITLSWKPLIHLFIPVFINAWIAKNYLGTIFNFGKSQSLLAQQVVSVVSTLICLVFTAMCSFQHAERASTDTGQQVTFFSSFYFIMVTLSTVGYGDITPTIWVSRILVVLVIFTALGVLPKQFEMLATTWLERQRLGGTYTKSSKRGDLDKHVVLCLPTLNPETLMDFLTEFFAYRRLQDHTVVILTQDDLQPVTKQIIQRNTWSNKVKYIKGSCLRDMDLMRVRIGEADGCFILSVDSSYPKNIADELTIMNAWAIKDFAPHVRQFVQIFRPEHEVYVDFASSVICEDEFKYAMLAYNCICPATSTLITLLLHTSRGEEGNQCDENWIRLYGKCSGNEIYTTDVKTSLIFKEYVGKPFPQVSLHAHRKYGITLIAVKRTDDPNDDYIKLNPGLGHILRETDKCYYLSITREQNMNFTRSKVGATGTSSALGKHRVSPSGIISSQEEDKIPKEIVVKGPNGVKKDVSKFIQPSGNAFESITEEEDNSDDSWIIEIEKTRLVCGFPPVTPYVGANPTACHLLKVKKKTCCMRLDLSCEHCQFLNAKDYCWANKPIILVSMEANNGIYNFVLPLRAHVLPRGSLKPIIIMLEKDPTDEFADALSWFPLVYWLKGSIQNLDDLLRAGIDVADNIVVTNRDNFTEDDEIGDCDTIVTVQKLFKFFPSMKITTELSSTTMMRFLHFQPGNPFAQYLSMIEKQEIEKGSQVAFMFRLQFASGNVFSASMIHTLLYQAILKDFVITLTRLLLGIDQTPGSGFLTGQIVKSSDLIARGTYGKMFNYLCASTGSIPIAVYRTHTGNGEGKFAVEITDSKLQAIRKLEEQEIEDIIKHRMESLGFKRETYDVEQPKTNQIMYVIINPHSDLPLEEGDFVYYLKPTPTRKKNSPPCTSTRSEETQTT